MEKHVIKILQLANAMEIISEIDEPIAGEIHASNPAIIMRQMQGEKMGLGLAPFCPYSDDKKPVVFNRAQVIAEITPSTGLVNEYNRMFGSGLVVPEKKLII